MDIEALERFIDEHFPQARAFGYELLGLDEDHVLLGLRTDETHLRPGGTVSGPVLMTLADTATYLIVLAHLGPVALAVTTNFNMHFMRKPEPGRLYARATLLKLGKRLAVAEVRLHGSDPGRLYAHATLTYSIPG
jgi:uncharacterized protein (TIGR00369 family)